MRSPGACVLARATRGPPKGAHTSPVDTVLLCRELQVVLAEQLRLRLLDASWQAVFLATLQQPLLEFQEQPEELLTQATCFVTQTDMQRPIKPQEPQHLLLSLLEDLVHLAFAVLAVVVVFSPVLQTCPPGKRVKQSLGVHTEQTGREAGQNQVQVFWQRLTLLLPSQRRRDVTIIIIITVGIHGRAVSVTSTSSSSTATWWSSVCPASDGLALLPNSRQLERHFSLLVRQGDLPTRVHFSCQRQRVEERVVVGLHIARHQGDTSQGLYCHGSSRRSPREGCHLGSPKDDVHNLLLGSRQKSLHAFTREEEVLPHCSKGLIIRSLQD